MSLVKVYTALDRMRESTKANIPFSIGFVSCSIKKGTSNGYVLVHRAVLRTGYSADKGIKSESLIAYYDLDKNKPGFFYLPLLIEYKGQRLCQ